MSGASAEISHSARITKLQLQHQNDECYQSITCSGELVWWSGLCWAGDWKGRPRNRGKTDFMVVLLLPQTPSGASILTLCKTGDSPMYFLCPGCLQAQAGSCYYREGKAKMGGSVAIPRPWLPLLQSILRGVLFIAPTANFSAPHQIPKVWTFLSSKVKPLFVG